MARLLHIETATSLCGVALFEANTVLASKWENVGMNHAEQLHVFIQRLFTETKTLPQQLNAISVSAGPGSYTGLRIGLSAAKGLAYALNVPLILCSTLQIMANTLKQSLTNLATTPVICPMLDARRMEIYTAIYDWELNIINPVAAVIADETWAQSLPNSTPIYFIGNGVPKCQPLLEKPTHYFDASIYPYPEHALQLVTQLYTAQQFTNVAYAEPAYLKPYFFATKKEKKEI